MKLLVLYGKIIQTKFFNYSYEMKKLVRKFYKSNLFINNLPNYLKIFIFRLIGLNAGFVQGILFHMI